MNPKIGIVGAGNMGRAFFEGISRVIKKDHLFVCDKSREKLDRLKTENASTDCGDILKKVEVVIMAIKPQSFREFTGKLNVSLANKLIISIMAGISLDRLARETNTSRIVRAMPNLPVQAKKGVIGWVATPAVGKNDIQLVKKIFSALGKDIRMNHESELDAITVLSGCGPAYFFLLTELLANKAVSLGFSPDKANAIAQQTLIGSAEMLQKSDQSARQWRQAVASKGGVTEAVLEYLLSHDFDKCFNKAVDAGLKRNKELNQS